MKKSERQGDQPQKVGYLKYLRLQKKNWEKSIRQTIILLSERNTFRAVFCIFCIVCRIGYPTRSTDIRSNT